MGYLAIVILMFFSAPQVVHEGNIQSVEAVSSGADYVISHDALESESSGQVPEILEKIAHCESTNSHFDPNGDVVIGKYNRYDIGKYQINSLYWGEEAKKLGYDIYTESGNEAMALKLFHRYGTDPWSSSKKCWANS